MLMALLAYVTHHQPFCLMISLGMAGGLGGFLVFNFPPAKIYMGDGGAYFLGFLIAILTMVSSNKGAVAAALIAPLFALALPIVDVSLAIVRRGLKGLPIFRPDRKHIHHRLMATGISKFKAVLLLYSISLACLGLAFVIFWSDARLLPIMFGLACLIFLAAAGSLSFSREWFSVGRVVGNSLEVRKQTRFALLLSRWMILEAERCLKVEDLWIDYLFVLRKLGFLKVRVELEQGTLEHTFADPNGLEPQKFRVSVETGNIRSLELQSPGHLGPKASELQSELAAEIWLNALRRWAVYHEIPPNLSQAERAPGIPASLATV
jgi:UDP-GlcNAc:undecaprenyl-phosphate GlcNAc-1-phosphate transferase